MNEGIVRRHPDKTLTSFQSDEATSREPSGLNETEMAERVLELFPSLLEGSCESD